MKCTGVGGSCSGICFQFWELLVCLLLCLTLFPAEVSAKRPVDNHLRLIHQTQGIERLKLIEEFGDSLGEKYPDTTITVCRIGLADKEINQHPAVKSSIQFQLGYAFFRRRLYDSTLIYLNQSLKIGEQENNNRHLARVYRLMGAVHMYQMDYPQALRYFQDALTKARQVDDKHAIGSALNYIGNVFRLYGDHESALSALLEAQQVYQEIGFEEGIAWSAFNLSKYYNTLQNYEMALEQAKISLDIYKEMAEIDGIRTGIVMVLSVINTIFIDQGNLDSALYYSFVCLNESESAREFTGVADALGSIGKIYYLQGRFSESIRYLNRSLEVKNRINDQMGVCNTNIYLARCYLAQDNYPKTLEHLQISQGLARFNNFRIYLQDIYKLYSDLHLRQKDYNRAYEFFKQSMILKDSINTLNYSERISVLKMRYEAEQKDQENLMLKKNNLIQQETIRRQKIFGVVFFLMLVVLIGLILMIQYSRKRLKEVNQELVLKNDEIRSKQKEIEEKNEALFMVNRDLEAKNDNLYQMAITDSLTGIYNRAYLFQNLQIELNRAIRHRMDLSCIIFDIDSFKQLNDKHGHLIGDEILKTMAGLINRSLRQEDIFGRYGGEEFIIIVPNANLEDARHTAEKIRLLIENHQFVLHELILKMTISFGVSSLQDNQATTIDMLIRYADHALYSAKNSGRNRVAAYQSD
ncbi:MAG: GGDEF domain-containing protein [Candidatus Delongbacteria bacterium]|nr:GGDEF domain-containing protein [Candidatus Delongbacteria bacterium]